MAGSNCRRTATATTMLDASTTTWMTGWYGSYWRAAAITGMRPA
ncbi:hypothetical protein ACN27B_21795 [Micromonospora sp. WMMD754]